MTLLLTSFAFLLSSAIIAVYMTIMFIISLIKKDNSIVDTAYGIGFIIIAWTTQYLFAATTVPQLLVTAMISIWGARLSTRIFIRNHGKPEDFRYKAWRNTWKWFKVRSFFQIYVLQGTIIILISSVTILLNSLLIPSTGYYQSLIVIGALLWLTGFIFESVGDYQLDCFIKKQQRIKAAGNIPEKTIMDEGLWSLTRHPNYFGEVTMWWGLYLIALSVVPLAPHIWIAIISPITITFLLLKVSGIPMLESKYKGNTEYEAYQRRTNAFFPWRKN